MKKIISVLLVLTMIFSMTGMMSFAADDSLSVVFATDVHYAWEKITNNGTIPELHINPQTNDYDINEALSLRIQISHTFLQQVSFFLNQAQFLMNFFVRPGKMTLR